MSYSYSFSLRSSQALPEIRSASLEDGQTWTPPRRALLQGPEEGASPKQLEPTSMPTVAGVKTQKKDTKTPRR